jgi:hypothetical protein
VTKITADKRKLGLLRIHIFYLADPFNGFMVINIAAEAINGIGGIDYYSAVFKAIGNLF